MSEPRARKRNLGKQAEDRQALEARLKNLQQVLEETDDLTPTQKAKLMKAFGSQISQQTNVRSIRKVAKYVHELNFGRVFNTETLRAASGR